MRLGILDGIRGHLLIMMMLAHLAFQPGLSVFGEVHHVRLIGLYDAEFLIFLSGMLVGFLYETRLGTSGGLPRFLGQRTVKIYRYYLISAVPFLIITLVAMRSGLPDELMPIAQVALMQNGGSYSDILPIYVYCFVLLLAATPLLHRFGPVALLLPSGLVYVASQASYATGFFGLSGLFMAFDVGAWQFLFFIAFVLGALHRQITGALDRLPDGAFLGLLALALMLTALQRTFSYYPLLLADPGSLPINWARMQLHPFHLTRIMVVVALFGLILMRPHALTRWPRAVMDWWFNLRLLRLTGKYSIQMFVFHVVLMAVVMQSLPHLSSTQDLVLAAICLCLFLAAPFAWDAWQKRQRARRAAPIPGE
ncbi:OpgC domain-containing protein [Mesobacterium pallidum]|uniref:OpgC domain-containing protein n=1 Tax=Mesobacterium pallidum TaxID=2872037 RepID=UPI001EE2DAC0|nr:OpgC domain-containing protein [Mesobacterium pallidum]